METYIKPKMHVVALKSSDVMTASGGITDNFIKIANDETNKLKLDNIIDY